ncbi:MAG: hypothetical protein WCT20_01470 [Candidatus Babeliales bacterium]
MKSNKIIMVSWFFFVHLCAFHIDNLHNEAPVSGQSTSGSHGACFKQICTTIDGIKIVTDPAALASVARDTLTYIDVYAKKRPDIIDPCGIRSIISSQQVKQTLQFIVKTFEADQAHGTHLLNDPHFISKHFAIIDWRADAEDARKYNIELPDSGAIRLTNYAIFCVSGSLTKTKEYQCALYRLKNETIRTAYTKQEIVAGALEKPKHRDDVVPLVWVTRDGLEDAQGMVMIKLAGGTYKFLNIYKNNGFAYDRKLSDVRKQKRYWFFKEQSNARQSALAIGRKFQQRSRVIFSGDIYNIGIGKVVALLYRNNATRQSELRLGILADNGGAFINNLYQLDLFSGIFSGRDEWRKLTADLPCYAHAYILCKR